MEKRGLQNTILKNLDWSVLKNKSIKDNHKIGDIPLVKLKKLLEN